MQTATTNKTAILALLAQAEELLDTATIDGMGENADEDVYDCFAELRSKFATVAEAVEYYVD